jgi:hypothetical protein
VPVVTIPTLGQYGLVADQPAQELPDNAFSTVENMRFRDGSAERFRGHVSIFTNPSVTPYYVTPFGTVDKRYWVHCGLTSVFADDGATRTNITGTALTGAIDDRFTGGALSGILILNNGKDIPRYWAGTGNTANLTGWDTTWRAKFVRTFKNFIIFGAPTKGGVASPHTIGWSSAADPGTLPTAYTAAPGNEAGDAPLGETPDLLVDSLTLGDVHIVYKEQSCYRMEYIGGQQVFAIKRIPGNYGMLARGCAAATPKGHVVLANGDIVLVDGYSEPRSLVVERDKNWFFQEQLDATYYARSFVVANPTKNEVWICYPQAGSDVCNKAFVWNWVNDTWGRRDLPNATYAAAGLLDYPAGRSIDALIGAVDDLVGAIDSTDYTPSDSRLIISSTAPALYLADAGGTFAGSAVNAVLERTGMAFGDPDRVKVLKSITPRVSAPSGTVLSIQMGASMSAEVDPDWSAPITYTVGSSVTKAFGFAQGKFLAYRVLSSSVQPWAVKSMTFDIQPMGTE